MPCPVGGLHVGITDAATYQHLAMQWHKVLGGAHTDTRGAVLASQAAAKRGKRGMVRDGGGGRLTESRAWSTFWPYETAGTTITATATAAPPQAHKIILG